MKFWILVNLIFVFVTNCIFCQTKLFEGYVLDAETKMPLAYANIRISNSSIGTISNKNGYFRLNDISNSKLILISYIGYSLKYISTDTFINNSIVFIEQNAIMLDEISITPDDRYLYEIFNRCRTKFIKNKLVQNSKVYCELETYKDESLTELMECYYNANFSGCELDDLNIKTGRVGLRPIDHGLFISTETSKVILSNILSKEDLKFPLNPFQLTEKKLKKLYRLFLVDRNDNDSLPYIIIGFKPKDTTNDLFAGQVLIHTKTNNPINITFKRTMYSDFPVHSLSPDNKMNRLDLEITRTYEEIEGILYFKYISLKYKANIQTRFIANTNISTNAVLYAYNYWDVFELPRFDFGETDFAYSDYVRINGIPYDSTFWNNKNEFKLNDRVDYISNYFNDSTVIKNPRLFDQKNMEGLAVLQFPFVTWSRNRVAINKFIVNDNPSSSVYGFVKSDLYNFNIQIFLDKNLINDSLVLNTATVFSPYGSYYKMPIDTTTLCFINIYFDIVEIERLKLLEEISKSNKSFVEIDELYDLTVAKLNLIRKRYFKEVEHGTNIEAMHKWNLYVLNNLNIDNFRIFNIEL